MSIPSRQIGWSNESNLLWEIAKQLEKYGCTLCNLNGTSGTSGVSPTLPISLSYGLFTQTGNSIPVTGTTVETTLVNGGIGTMTVPANAFVAGDSFRVDMGGVMNVANNQTMRIRVKAGSILLLDSGIQNLSSSISNDIWSLSLNFTVRQIGAATVASIVSLGRFSYVKINNGAVEGFGFNTLNNTTFDTTISNTLDITVQWGSNNAGNNIYSDVFTLYKIY